MIRNLRNTIAHEIATGGYDYEKTGIPQEHQYKAADRIIARLKQESLQGADLNKEFTKCER